MMVSLSVLCDLLYCALTDHLAARLTELLLSWTTVADALCFFRRTALSLDFDQTNISLPTPPTHIRTHAHIHTHSTYELMTAPPRIYVPSHGVFGTVTPPF